jgi:Beta-lactamase
VSTPLTLVSRHLLIQISAGSIYSSANDMSALGRSILKSTLLTPAITRRWLKPTTLTSDVKETVGYPWGIRRIAVDPSYPFNLITSYNKGGSIGNYASALSIIPELNIGFSILIAGDKTMDSLTLASVLGYAILPALQSTARDDGFSLYGGTYANSTSRSSITFTRDSTKPGLGIANWTNNGVNMLNTARQLLGRGTSSTFEARLYSTDLRVVASDGSQQISFKAVFEDLATQASDSMFVAACGTWIGPTGLIYGSLALDEFVFSIDASGKVVSVENAALRATLNKS